MKNLTKTLFFSFIGAIFRRWFGGGFGKFGDITRGVKYVVLFCIIVSMYYLKDMFDWQNWRMYAVFLAFAVHWAVGHGDYFYVYDTNPDEGRIKWIDWVLRKVYGEDRYYNFKGNVTGLFVRYTSTSCLVSFCVNNALFLLSGALTALVYAVLGKSDKAIPYSEFLSGAVNFALLFICI